MVWVARNRSYRACGRPSALHEIFASGPGAFFCILILPRTAPKLPARHITTLHDAACVSAEALRPHARFQLYNDERASAESGASCWRANSELRTGYACFANVLTEQLQLWGCHTSCHLT